MNKKKFKEKYAKRYANVYSNPSDEEFCRELDEYTLKLLKRVEKGNINAKEAFEIMNYAATEGSMMF